MRAFITLFLTLSLFVSLSTQKAKILTDENFEHDTQATSGSTTGDWFLMFCRASKGRVCSESVRGAWDELYGRLRGRATVAYLDITESRQTQ